MFNIAQLATYEQAKDLAARLSNGPIIVGGGVKAGTDEAGSIHVTDCGIYRPVWNEQPWSQEPFYENPATGEKFYFLHFRFNNGTEGMNVGLINDKFSRYPMSPLYVMGEIAKEAEMLKPQV